MKQDIYSTSNRATTNIQYQSNERYINFKTDLPDIQYNISQQYINLLHSHHKRDSLRAKDGSGARRLTVMLVGPIHANTGLILHHNSSL